MSQQEIKVMLNDTPIEFDVAPVILNGRTMVPFRALFEALGMEVNWNEQRETATASKDNLTITMAIDYSRHRPRGKEFNAPAMTIFGENIRHRATVNGELVELDTPAIMRNGRMLVPLRFIAEATGATVEWNEETHTVIITTN
jgi:hypothetical protein